MCRPSASLMIANLSGRSARSGSGAGAARLRILMLARLSIRDIVLIERLDIDFASGLAVLTGETGAGKSILLDAFALALGARGDAALVRHGAEQGQVTAAFEVPRVASGARAAGRARHSGRGRTDPAPRPARRRPHPRLRQRPAGQRAGVARARRGAGRNSRPARRARAGRRRRAIARCSMPTARWRATPREVARLWEERRAKDAALAASARRGRARAARGRLAAPRGRGIAASSARRPARKPRSPRGAPR